MTSWHRALAKRADMLHKAASIRHQLAMGQPPAKPTAATQMADHVLDSIVLQLAEPQQRIKSLEGGHSVKSRERASPKSPPPSESMRKKS